MSYINILLWSRRGNKFNKYSLRIYLSQVLFVLGIWDILVDKSKFSDGQMKLLNNNIQNHSMNHFFDLWIENFPEEQSNLEITLP